jgi:N-acyl-D-amino-acid deacylase
MPEFDTIIRGGTIIDGTRMPRFAADIGIKDGRIARIGQLKDHDARKVIDAGGLFVVPG